MAIVPCGACGAKISTSAKVCPKCGHDKTAAPRQMPPSPQPIQAPQAQQMTQMTQAPQVTRAQQMPQKPQAPQMPEAQCWKCSGAISASARFCPHCGSNMAERPQPARPAAQQMPRQTPCIGCGERIPPAAQYCPQCGTDQREEAPAAPSPAPQSFAPPAPSRISECVNCGGEIVYEAGSQSLKCPYCNASNEIERAENALASVVEKIVPMTVSLDDLEKRVYGYMASGDYTQDDMLEASTIVKRECLYVPAYIFQIGYEANWTASFGYDRKEAYTAYRNVTRNGDTYREAYTAYKTVTDWRPANGVDSGEFIVSTYAGSSLRDSNLDPAELVRSAIRHGSITDFNPSFTRNIQVEAFSVTESNALASLKGDIDGVIDNSVKRHAQGDHQRDWHWHAQSSHTEYTANVPICHAVFDYKGTEYHYWIDGTGSVDFRGDKLPEDHQRKQRVNLGYIPVGVAVVVLLVSWYAWAFTWAGFIVAAILAGYAALRRSAIIGYSKKIRSAILAQMEASTVNTKDLSSEERERMARSFQRPEKPFFAQTAWDKLVLPALSVAAVLSIAIPSASESQARLTASTMQTEQTAAATEKSGDATAHGAESPQVAASTVGDSQQESLAGHDQANAVQPAAEQTFQASFDCGQASTDAEKLICSNRELAEADVQLSQAYRAALGKSSDKGALKREQRNWITNQRDAATDPASMLQAYQERIAQLSDK